MDFTIISRGKDFTVKDYHLKRESEYATKKYLEKKVQELKDNPVLKEFPSAAHKILINI